jgi:hypothetical protein
MVVRHGFVSEKASVDANTGELAAAPSTSVYGFAMPTSATLRLPRNSQAHSCCLCWVRLYCDRGRRRATSGSCICVPRFPQLERTKFATCRTSTSESRQANPGMVN